MSLKKTAAWVALGQAVNMCSDCLLVPGEYYSNPAFQSPPLDAAMDAGRDIWTLPTSTLNFGQGLSVPVHSEFVLCATHEPQADALAVDDASVKSE